MKINFYNYIIMINNIINIAETYIQPDVEYESFENKGKLTRVFILTSLFVLTLLIFSLLIGQYLWNNVLTKCVTIVKPINSFAQFIGLYILIMILFSR